MGQDPSDDEIFEMIAQVDDDGSNEIDFGEFCKVIAIQKAATAGQNDESDTSAPPALAPLSHGRVQRARSRPYTVVSAGEEARR